MKYKAVVSRSRDGLCLSLYVKILFIWIPIDGYNGVNNKIFNLVFDEVLNSWKSYYQDKLTINDCRKL